MGKIVLNAFLEFESGVMLSTIALRGTLVINRRLSGDASIEKFNFCYLRMQ
jgi:hypothetical protein